MDTIINKRISKIGGFEIYMNSTAGLRTTVVFPKLKIIFDIGIMLESSTKANFVFISHGHVDHIGSIVTYISQRGMEGRDAPLIVVPKIIVEKVKNIINSFEKLSEMKLNYSIEGMENVVNINKVYHVKSFKTNHRVDSLGYIIYKQKTSLKPEYAEGLRSGTITKKNLKEYSKMGINIRKVVNTPEIAYTGDTTLDGISTEAKSAKLLIMEVTYVGNKISIETARQKGHIHLSELKNNTKSFKNENILMMHFSKRHTKKYIFTELGSVLPRDFLDRLYVCIGNTILKYN